MPPHRRSRRVSAAGFTLVELMITVAIIAIIAAVAMPIYNGYIERSYIQQGLQHLSEARTRMEQYYMDNRTYSSGGVTCGFDVTKFKTGTSSKEKFDFSCLTSAAGDTYTVTAKGMTGTPVEGFTYTIDQAAIGTSTISKAGWNSGSCWILKAGEKCT